MTASRWILAIAFGGLLILAAALWYLMGPGPLTFAGAETVRLAEYQESNPTGVPAELAQSDPITRGRYLTDAANCQTCHTREGGVPFAGGRAFKTQFGTLYSSNITPDRDTGIGAWSTDDFLRAVHKGVRPDGTHLYPAFPYAAYTYLTDDDVRAIWEYLRSLPAAVTTRIPANELAFPFNQRWLMGIWAALFNPDRRFAPNVRRSPEWNRGAYLAEGLAHCGDCHTPRNTLQALDNRRKFSGALTAGWRAYNITNDPMSGVGAWSEEGLARYLTTGHAASHGTASGPMAEAIDSSLSKLTPSDIRALVTYVRSIPPIASPNFPAVRTQVADATQGSGDGMNPDSLGKQVFAGACAGCHGWTGTSPVIDRATLIGSRAINDPTAVNVVQTVLSGSHSGSSGATGSMPAFGEDYSDAEIAAVANYVTARFGGKSSAVTASTVAHIRTTT